MLDYLEYVWTIFGPFVVFYLIVIGLISLFN